MTMRRITVALAVVVAALGITAAVSAGIPPDGAGVIHGCYAKSTPPGGQPGALRVIDTSLGQNCQLSESAVNWSQTGPPGPQGPQGVQGARGPTGPKGDKGDPGVSSYSAGTGLALSGNTFSVAGSFQLPQGCSAGQSPYLLGVPLSHPWSCFTAANASESCPSGKFQNGVDANGDITCSTPSSGGGSSASDVWVTGNPFADVPESDAGAVIASLSLPAGAFLVNAKGTAVHDLGGIGATDDFVHQECELRENGSAFDTLIVQDQSDGRVPSVPFTLTGVPSMGAAFTVDLWCQGLDSGQHAENVVLTALQVGTVNQQ
jgi:hypothetical protein